MKQKQKLSMKVLETIYLIFTLIGMFVVLWAISSMALGTYALTCETIQKKLMVR